MPIKTVKEVCVSFTQASLSKEAGGNRAPPLLDAKAPTVRSEVLGAERIVAVMRADDPLSALNEKSVADLARLFRIDDHREFSARLSATMPPCCGRYGDL